MDRCKNIADMGEGGFKNQGKNLLTWGREVSKIREKTADVSNGHPEMYSHVVRNCISLRQKLGRTFNFDKHDVIDKWKCDIITKYKKSIQKVQVF